MRRFPPARRLAIVVATAICAAPWLGCSALGVGEPPLSVEERRDYGAALALQDEDPAAAEKRYEAFLQRWPDSRLADDAGVRMGELALARGERELALERFLAVVRDRSGGDRADLARLRAAQLELALGRPQAADALMQRLRISRLSRPEQAESYRLLAELAEDPVSKLRRLAMLRSHLDAEDEIAAVDVEIDRLLRELDRAQLERASDRLGREPPAARVLLRMADLSLEGGDVAGARDAFDAAARLDLPAGYREELARVGEALLLREQGVPDVSDLPTLVALANRRPPATRGASGALGVVLPLSGPFARFGEESLHGVLLAAGVFGPVDGSPAEDGSRGVRVVVRDSEGRPERAAAAVRELAADEEVSAIVGPLLADECEAAAAVAEQAGVPLLALSAREEIAVGRANVLRLRTMPREEVEVLVDHAMRALDARTFAILYPGDRYGLGLRDMFWEAVEQRGGRVVGVARYEPDATDFAEPIRQLVGYTLLTPDEKKSLEQRDGMFERARRLPAEEAKALREKARAMTGPNGQPLPPIVDFDALFIPETHEKVVLIAPQLAFHEAVGTRLLGPNGWDHPDLVPIARDHVEGALFTSLFFADSTVPFVHDFAQRFETVYGLAPDLFAAQGYDAANLVLVQLARGRHERDDVRDGVLATREYPGVTGVLSMRSDGNARKRPFLLGVERGHIIQVQ